MTTSVSQTTRTLTVTEQLFETRLRRQLFALLAEIKDLCVENDSVTEQIALWRESFYQALRFYPDEQVLADNFFPLLKGILVDEFNIPLDSNAQIGNNGIVYSSLSLAHIRKTTPPYKLKDLKTVPHRLVNHIIYRLEPIHHVDYFRLTNEKLIELYKAVPSENVRQSLRDRAKELKQPKAPLTVEINTDLIERIEKKVDPLIKGFQQKIAFQFEQTQNITEMDRQNKEYLAAQVKQIDLGLSELEATSETLNAKSQVLSNRLDSLEAQNAQLRQQIAALERAMKKQKKNRFLKIALFAALSVAGSWAMIQLAEALTAYMAGAATATAGVPGTVAANGAANTFAGATSSGAVSRAPFTVKPTGFSSYLTFRW